MKPTGEMRFRYWAVNHLKDPADFKFTGRIKYKKIGGTTSTYFEITYNRPTPFRSYYTIGYLWWKRDVKCPRKYEAVTSFVSDLEFYWHEYPVETIYECTTESIDD